MKLRRVVFEDCHKHIELPDNIDILHMYDKGGRLYIWYTEQEYDLSEVPTHLLKREYDRRVEANNKMKLRLEKLKKERLEC